VTSSTPATKATDGKVFWGSNFYSTSYYTSGASSARSTYGYGGGSTSARYTQYEYAYGGLLFGIDTNKGGNPFLKVDPNNGTITGRTTAYIQPNQTGSSVAWVVADWNTTFTTYPAYYGFHSGDMERLIVICNIATDAEGNAVPGAAGFVVDSGRISSSIAFSADGQKVVYGQAAAGSSEGNMMIKTAEVKPSGVTQLTSQGGLQTSGGPARFAILNAGR
jgi:hypothetical protein